MRRWMVFGIGITVLSGIGARGQRHRSDTVEPDIRLAGDNLEQTVRCHHNAVHVLGSGSRLTIEGSCTTVYVEGNRNWMEIQDADWIKTEGNLNSVMFLNPGTRSVDSGRANTIAPKWQQ